MASPTWARVRRPCSSWGRPVVPRRHTKLPTIKDGTSNTLMMSEILVLPETAGWGGPYSDAQTALGGQVFTGYKTPNALGPTNADALCRQGEWWNNVRDGWFQQKLPTTSAAPNQGTPAQPVTPPGGTPADAVIDSNGHKQQYVVARSKHAGGVNTSRCDGSVAFFNDNVDLLVWNAVTSASGGETVGD